MSLSDIPNSVRLHIRSRDDGQCRYCHLRQTGQAAAFHIDHIIPRSKDGKTIADNLALQCPNCGLHKSNKTEATDPATQVRSPLFHPLRDDWSEHFVMKRDGTIDGLTAIGRTTVEALRMNEPMPKTARVIQLVLGLL